MTAIPIPPVSRLEEDENAKLFEEASIKKNLTSAGAFDTPAVLRKRVSRLSQNFQQLPAEFIKVFLRFRPFTDAELKNNEDRKCTKISEDRHILTVMAPEDSKTFKASNRGIGESVRHYTFTKIFDPVVGQKDFYQQTSHPLVQQFIEGSNGLIFTYGVTNAGKTYTLQGTPGNEGIIPQSIEVIFDQIGDKMLENVMFAPKMANSLCSISDDEKRSRDSVKQEVMAIAEDTRHSAGQKSQTSLESSGMSDATDTSPENMTINTTTAIGQSKNGCEVDQAKEPLKYALFVSFVEVYRELVYDLLVPLSKEKEKRRSRPVLAIAEDRKGVSYVKGMREIQVSSPQELLQVLSVGQRNLHVAATKLNKDSSRSHCIFTITLVQVMDIPEPHGARISKISFCDLAGSERANKTGEAGDRLKEAGKINTSLMKLGMCIADLRHNQKYKDDKMKHKAIFFRESKLTRLFRNYLLGSGRACMIVNANMCASGFDENIHVLKFSAIAKEVQIINKSKRSEVIKKSRTTLLDEAFENTMKDVKNQRATIAWEKKLTPVKDVEEEEEEEEEAEESEEEEGSDQSDSDSDEFEQSVECDVSYWKNREKKYLELIDMLKKALFQEKKKCKDNEVTLRKECSQFMRTQIVEIEQQHREQIDDTVESLMGAQKVRLDVMANLANINMQELKEGFEKKFWELTANNTALEKELNERREQVDTKATELLNAEEKVTTLELQANELKMELDKRDKELAASKRRGRRSSRYSVGSDEESAVQELLEKNEEGKSIIQSLVIEMEEYRTQIENMQEECEKSKEELSRAKKETEDLLSEKSKTDEEYRTQIESMQEEREKLKQELNQVKKENENLSSQKSKTDGDNAELNELKKGLQQRDSEIAELEKIACDLAKNSEIFYDEIPVEDGNTFKFTEGILRYLPGFLHKKDDQLTQLATDLEKEVEDKIAIKERLSATTVLLEEATIQTDSLQSDLAAKDGNFEKLLAEKTEAEKSWEKKLEDAQENLKTIKENQAIAQENLKTIKENQAEQLGALNQKLEVAEQASAELKEKVENLGKELEEKKTFEQQLMKETERLHAEAESLKSQNLKVEQVSLKRSSDASEMIRDVEILTKDRDDLVERLENLRKKLTEVTKEKTKLQEELRENIANTTTVQSSTEIMELKSTIMEKEAELKTLASEKDDICSIREDLQKEVSRLQDELNEAEKARAEEKCRFLAENEECQNLVSQMKETMQKFQDEVAESHEDNKNLTQERCELTKTVEDLENDLKTSVLEISQMETKMEKTSEKLATEKEELCQRQNELEQEIASLRKNLKELQEEKDTSLKLRITSEEEKSDLEDDFATKQEELEKVKTSFTDFKNKTKEHIDQAKIDHQAEMKALKESLGKEIKQLQSELLQSSKTAQAREKELSSFRVNRDRIVAALEVQIKNDKATNELLKTNLDEQVSENVKLKSQNVAATAEITELRKRTDKEEERRSTGASASLNLNPVVCVKREALSPQPEAQLSEGQSQPEESVKETENIAPVGASEEDSLAEKRQASGRSTRGRKRGSSAGGRSAYKRGNKAKSRPATPLPEAPPEEEENEEITSPPKKRRTKSRSADKSTVTTTTRLKSEQLAGEQGVLDDSELMKETGNARQFPESTIEIDATPNLSKKAAKTRKRAAKKDYQHEPEETESGSASTRSTRRKLRANTNTHSDGSKTCDEDQPSVSASASKTSSKVGSMIRNSPVGHALKCIEEAISPASKSPKKTKKQQPEDQNKRTRRRLVKLHPDDISSPLEATPGPEHSRDSAAHSISDTPGRMMRRLRNRK